MNPRKEEMDNWQVGEMVYVLRLLIDRLERRDCSDEDMEILRMAYRSLNSAPWDIHRIADKIETAFEERE